MKMPALFVWLWVTLCAVSAADPELTRLEARAERVTIIRDDFGVPHIYGRTDADVVFGMLYAQAEDDFNRVERNYIWAIGRLAEVEGESEIYSDLRARLFMTVEEAKAAYASAPDWLKALCDSFADGLNYYLLTHAEVQSKLLKRFEPWMPMFFSEGSIGGDIEQIPIDGIRDFYGDPRDGSDLRSIPESGSRLKEPGGSNGFAISGKLTESGNAMLLINPHTSFFFRGEIHVVSEEGLNAYGAVTWGQFFVYQGFNEHTGWMHTSTHVDFMDDFVEKISKEEGRLVARYGNEKRPVKSSQVVLKYKKEDGTAERTFTMYHTGHGPVTHRLGTDWVATRMNWDPVNALRQSFIRTKCRNYDEFRKMMNIRRNSSNNTVFADSGGTIAYFHGNFVPRRDARFDYSKPVDGSDPATDWQGLHTVDETVTLLNPANGWIQNCNSTPFTAAAEFSPKAAEFPRYMAPDDENFRAVHALRVLTSESGFTLSKLIDTAYDPYLPGFEKLISGLIAAYDQFGKEMNELADPIRVLRQWDLKVRADSVAMTLGHFFGLRCADPEAKPEGMSEMEWIDRVGTTMPPAERLLKFTETISQLELDFGRWDTAWGEVNRYQRLNGDIKQPFDDAKPSLPVGMASGYWGALASFGADRPQGEKRIYGTSGNSFVAVVEFGPRVKARTLLAGGQSGDPASRHFDDQAHRYVDRQFKEVPFYREDVERRAVKRYHPGKPSAQISDPTR